MFSILVIVKVLVKGRRTTHFPFYTWLIWYRPYTYLSIMVFEVLLDSAIFNS